MRDEIDFQGLADRLLDRAATVVPEWLPGGKRQAHEWVCGGLEGGAGRSCSVNLVKGKWGDFNTDERGNDLTSLYAAIHGLSQAEAARELNRRYGWEQGEATAPLPDRPRPTRAPAPTAKAKPAAEDEGWRTQRPVPPHAPKATFRHYHRHADDIVHVAEYRVGDELHGYVVRFRTSDGGKETLPYTWCCSARDGAAKWHWRQFDVPRPLYLPAHALPQGRTVILVEGEKKAGVLQAALDAVAPGIYCVVSWAGGCKAWDRAEWAWLAGCTIIAWADADAKRESLTAAERKATPDKAAQLVLAQAKPLLPEHRQPGMAAMLSIGQRLRDEHGCQVQLLPIPQPGEVADGWDCADAIEADGWDGARLLAFFAQAYALPHWAGGAKPGPDAAGPDAGATREPPAAAKAGQGGGGRGGAGGDDGFGADDDEDAFREHLAFICAQLKCKTWDVAVNRKLIIAALTKAPRLKGCLGYNELTSAPGTLTPWPWRDKAGLLAETDDLRLGDWLSSTYQLKAASRAALSEAVDTVADMHRYHPIRDWLREQAWDDKPRMDKWLMWVLRMDPATVPKRRQRYLALMGRYMLMGLVARIMEPGIKFDYSPVFEGKPGVGKSTLVLELVGKAFFSDTHFDIGNGKDGMEQLEGLWAYELSELTAFKRADSEQIKQFFSSTVDRFRGAYGKFVQPHPRQCVIFCTTNKRQYLYDLTGNRRFWPVWIDQPIRLEWLRQWRGQLFAEALRAWEAGERFFPTREEEEAYFVPEQELRLVETTVQSKLYEMLTREGAPGNEGRASCDFNQHTGFVTLHGLVQALGADAAKSTSLLETQIRGWLESHGWEAMRESSGQRRRGYRQPAVWPPAVDEEDSSGSGDIPAAPINAPTGHQAAARAVAVAEVSDDEPF